MSIYHNVTFTLTSLTIGLALIGPTVAAFGGETAACPEPVAAACDSARVDLATAQSEVQAAADRKALWTTAARALKAAQDAFERGDYAEAARVAHFASDQARLGIAQTQYPLFPPPNPGGSR